ncbi:MAG TPA: DMT family transporter, partial [Candidatus Agrococcus pullicola]|nr:DMT family transporter [Candidatus Agrococcus pullicola]
MKRLLAMLGAFCGGSAMVMQSRVNGELGSRIDSGIVAALISFVGGLIILVIAAALSRRTHRGIRSAIAAFRSGDIP